jgi:hypothetical protein
MHFFCSLSKVLFIARKQAAYERKKPSLELWYVLSRVFGNSFRKKQENICFNRFLLSLL